MSMKNMTVAQLRTDLETLNQRYPGGIPVEQNDRVNAIRTELKRRGEDPNGKAALMEASSKPIDALNDEELAKEYRSLSERVAKEPSNEDLQNRFADARFEMRKRSKNGAAVDSKTEQTAPMRSPLPPRALEFAEGDAPASEPAKVEAPKTIGDVVVRRSSAAPQWRADASGGDVIIRHTGFARVQVSGTISVEEAEAFITTLQVAVASAKAAS